MNRILINWYYERKDLVEPLLGLADEAEVIFLFKYKKEELPEYLQDYKNISVVFWGDFTSPGQMLRKVKPDKVVFHDLESFNQIALNIAARNRKIPTIVLQHGLRGSLEVEEALSLKQSASSALTISETSIWSLKFFLWSLSWRNIFQLPSLFRFMLARKKGELTAVLTNHQFELRRADLYLEFSVENTGYHKKRDGVPDERFILTGNPAFDEYFEYLNSHNKPADPPYYLLLDCPFTEANFLKDPGITKEKKDQYLLRLANIARKDGVKLKVKLHPLSYGNDTYYKDETIEYLEDTDLLKLIDGSIAVFFVHFTSLAPVVLRYKPSVYFDCGLTVHTGYFNKLKVTTWDPFVPKHNESIEGDVYRPTQEELLQFLYKTDGRAIERIKKAILGSF